MDCAKGRALDKEDRMTERTPMSAEWLSLLQLDGEMRELVIVDGMRQRPDYPPLSPCPTCDSVSERIVSRMEDPTFEQYDTGILVDFKPCGHGFRVSAEEMLHASR